MNASSFSVFATTSALLLAGCAIGPDYHRPAVDTPAAFKEVGNWNPAEPAELAPRSKWWQAFDDPALNDLEDRVEVSNNTLRIAEARLREAQAASTIASEPA